ncbi:MAG: methyltransferase domain-containing protein [Clostridia bacterium]|nr:methyltransferase domain-containing protein [Clostridia bacterium]
MTEPPGQRRSGPSSHDPATAAGVLDALGVGSGGVFMDLGCGPGDYALDAAHRVGPGGAVLALDTWGRVLTELHEDAVGSDLPSILPLRADISAAHLPVATGRADACLLAMVLHMPGRASQLGGLLNEIHRVLRPGGRLGIVEHLGHEHLPAGHPARHLTPEWLTAMAHDHGFERPELTNLGRSFLLVLTRTAS